MFTTLAAVITTVAIASAIVLYALKKMVSHRLRAMTNRNHVASFSVAASQEQDDVPDAAIPDDNSSPSVMQTCCPLLPPSSDPRKPTLVLDLDETLVRAEFDEEPPAFPTRSIKVGDLNIWLALRPFVHQFLSSLAAHYELVVWTAGTEPYGRAVVKELDPMGLLISHSLFRQHCTLEDNRFIKDLSRLGRDERTRICDNNPVSFFLQQKAVILVKDFFGDPGDKFLKKLLCHLTKMALLKNYDLEFTTHEPEILDVPKVELVEPEEFSFVSPEDDAVEIQVCNRQLALPCVTNNTAISTVFEEQDLPQESAESTVPKRPRRPRVSNGGPLRRSPRLAKKYPRRSPRLVAKRLAAKP